MPANKKHLTQSTLHKTLKVTAAILGGYLLTLAVHLCLSLIIPKDELIMTMAFSGFILWPGLMILAFLAKNGWKVWGFYLLLSFIFLIPVYLKYYL